MQNPLYRRLFITTILLAIIAVLIQHFVPGYGPIGLLLVAVYWEALAVWSLWFVKHEQDPQRRFWYRSIMAVFTLCLLVAIWLLAGSVRYASFLKGA
ncbi:MAG: hypothetical protein IT367_12920 [Candidatus Hydrogenedentes bacterium]|nr:hypothetical protein [Candidatus Hydrogenedentota bacterium]